MGWGWGVGWLVSSVFKLCGKWTEVFEIAILWSNMCVKWTQTACYMHCLVNSYWSELDIVCGSTRE